VHSFTADLFSFGYLSVFEYLLRPAHYEYRTDSDWIFLQQEIFPNSFNSFWLAPLTLWNITGTLLVHLPLIEGEYIEQKLCNIFSLTPQIPWNRVLPEKVTGHQVVKKLPAFYGTPRFIATFTRARHLSLSRAISISSMPPSHILKIYFNIILPLRLVLSSGLFLFVSPPKPCSAPLLSPLRVICRAHLILPDLTTRKLFGD